MLYLKFNDVKSIAFDFYLMNIIYALWMLYDLLATLCNTLSFPMLYYMLNPLIHIPILCISFFDDLLGILYSLLYI